MISSQSQTSTLLVLLVLFLFLAAYFLGPLYLYARFSMEAYRDSFTDMHKVHQRSVCLTQMFFYAREDMQAGTYADLENSTIN